MADAVKITGVICTHNRERFLERCIESLCQQTLDSGSYEILVVDNGSTDNTRQICENYRGIKNFRYLYEPVLGLSTARNTGWQHARGNYVGYLDDDATAAPTWFEKALWCFENIAPVPEWVGGPIDLEWEVPGPDWINEELCVPLGKVDWGDEKRFLTRPWERLGGGNSFYLLSILKKMGGFDSRLGRKKNLLLSGEETQFQHRLRAMNGRLYYHPGIRIFHFVPIERMAPRFFYRRYYWGGITDYIMSKTLQDVAYQAITDAEKQEQGTALSRLFKNLIRATGLSGNQGAVIRSRIYLAYVYGWLVAKIKYSRTGGDA